MVAGAGTVFDLQVTRWMADTWAGSGACAAHRPGNI